MDIEKIANYLATQSLIPWLTNGTDVRVTAEGLVYEFHKHKNKFSPEEQDVIAKIVNRAKEIIYEFSEDYHELPE